MGKLAALLTAGSGTAAVSVGGFYLVKNSGTGEASGDTKGATEPTQIPKETDYFEEFKKGDDCVKDVFATVENLSDLSESKEITTNGLNGDISFFGTQSAEDNKNKSCLLISIDRKEYSVNNSTKWKGTLSWSWSFMNNDKGFITFNVAKTSTSLQQLDVEGVFYLLEKSKESDGEKWKIKHHIEIKSKNKAITSSDFDNQFPKNKNKDGSNLFKVDSKDYWDFLDEKGKLSEICGESECKDNPTSSNTKSKKWSWKGVAGGGDKVGEWSDNLKWFENIYGKDYFALESKIDSFSGNWQEATEKGK